VHRLLREDDEVRAAIRERLGDRVFGADGTVSRGAVAQIVFADREQLAWLESLLHPRVSREYLQWREDLARLPEPPAVSVTEVPLLYEVGADARFDFVVAITAPGDLRAGRASVPLAGRSERLLPDEEKLQRADFAYVNDGSFEDLDAFVASVMARLTSE
jgi:dephospho-CoA kinase